MKLGFHGDVMRLFSGVLVRYSQRVAALLQHYILRDTVDPQWVATVDRVACHGRCYEQLVRTL